MSVGVRTVDRATAGQLPEKIGNLLHESRWLALGALALYLAMAFWGFSKDDPGWSHAVVSSQLHNPTGHAGAWIADLMLYLFGLSAWWWIVLLVMFMWWGFRRLNSPLGHVDRRPLYIALSGFVLLLVASSAIEALRVYSLKAELPLSESKTTQLSAASVKPYCCRCPGCPILPLTVAPRASVPLPSTTLCSVKAKFETCVL